MHLVNMDSDVEDIDAVLQRESQDVDEGRAFRARRLLDLVSVLQARDPDTTVLYQWMLDELWLNVGQTVVRLHVDWYDDAPAEDDGYPATHFRIDIEAGGVVRELRTASAVEVAALILRSAYRY